MKKALAIIITILLVIGIVLGCIYWYKAATTPNEEVSYEPIFTLENYPKVDASLAIHPLVDSIASNFLGVDESELDFEYTKTRTSEVYRNLIDGKVDVMKGRRAVPENYEEFNKYVRKIYDRR